MDTEAVSLLSVRRAANSLAGLEDDFGAFVGARHRCGRAAGRVRPPVPLRAGGVGPGNYTTIQAAVDAATPGDTVFVFPGTYFEQVSVPKTLNLVGADRNTTVIDGGGLGGLGDVVSVAANWVNVTGFWVTNSSFRADDAGIKFLGVSNGRIFGNNISRNWGSGVYLIGSTDTTIEDNAFAGSLIGHPNVRLVASDSNVIRNNTLVNNAGIRLENSSDNLVTGNLFNVTWYTAVQLVNSSRNRVSRNAAVGTYTAGVLAKSARQETIENNTVPYVQLVSSVGITVADNVMTRGVFLGDGGQPFDPSDLSHWNTHDIRPTNLVNGRPVVYWKNVTGGVVPAGAAQVLLANATGVVIENQTFDNAIVGVESGFSSGIRIANVSGWRANVGILLAATRASVIENVSFPISSVAVWLSRSDGNVVANSSLAPDWSWAIRLESSFRNTIRSVNASNSAAFSALEFENSGDNLVSDSTFTGIGLEGARLRVSSNNTFTGTTFARNGREGVSMTGSDRNTFSGCTFADNGEDGVHLMGSNNNTILESWVERNGGGRYGGVGVNVTGSVGNRVYHNNIVGNARQAADDGVNAWNDSYPSGGNYWSDYAGADVFQEPDQDVPGSDGIGDTPYAIDADSADRYPLISPLPLGRGRPPSPPLVRPARLAGMGLADVEVSWQPSPDDGGGENDVVRYEIWVGASFDTSAAGYTFLASVPAGVTSYTDWGAGVGNPANRFYQIRAVDADGFETPAREQEGKYAIPLQAGTNLVALPLFPSDVSFDAAFQTVPWSRARMFINGAGNSDGWFLNDRLRSMEALPFVDLRLGVWIELDANATWTIAGLVPSKTDIHLRAGWNLVGFPTQQPRTASDLLTFNGFRTLEGFDPNPPSYLRAMSLTEDLLPGRGYWVSVAVNTTVYVWN